MADPLYYIDPGLGDFEALVLAEKALDSGLGIQLDRSAFFPGGGGQPEDRGTLEGVPVTGFSERDGTVLHLVDEARWRAVFPESAAGATVRCRIDETRRQDYREQHTGQHVVSACLKRLYRIDTHSVHFGEETTTIETSVESLPEGCIPAVEEEANRIIEQNPRVEVFSVEEKDLPVYELRRTPDLTGPLRVVRIPGIDTAACCGVHLESLAPLGLVKITGEERIRGRVRIHMVCGGRAAADYSKKTEILRRLRSLLTCGEDRVVESVEALLDEGRSRKKLIGELRGEIFRSLAEALWQTSPRHSFAPDREVPLIITEIPGFLAEDLAGFVAPCLERGPAFVVAAGSPPDPEGTGKISWIAAHNLGPEPDLKKLLSDITAAAKGKGGGGPARFQGAFPGRENYESFICALQERLGTPDRQNR
jgi:alanyl-tRNA synthetase